MQLIDVQLAVVIRDYLDLGTRIIANVVETHGWRLLACQNRNIAL